MKKFILFFFSISIFVNVFADSTSNTVCIGNMCFPVDSGTPSEEKNSVSTHDAVSAYAVVASADGYMGRDQFLNFLHTAAKTDGTPEQTSFTRSPLSFLAEKGWPITLLLIFLAGIALNLTPCVLPMIPVQLAILGIGHGKDSSKKEGLLRGIIYGSAMALSYGILGAVIVRSGGFFGTLQSSPWFNLSISVLFVFLALALFDVIYIDFARFGKYNGKSAGLAAVFATGAVDAILAGSCVAPALLAVLVLAGALYAEGHIIAIALPFILGLGMGFPWPFIATGLAALPKPGSWMKRVKWIFGTIVILLAVYFANLASVGFNPNAPKNQFKFAESVEIADLPARLATADMTSKPVILDFWASWCRNCSAMERVTFKDPEITYALENTFTLIRVRAEDPTDPVAAEILREFNVIGIPAFRVINGTHPKLQQ